MKISAPAPQERAVPVKACSKWRMDVIGQPSQRGSTACFQRALNYASLSFLQPHTGRQIKDASAEVLPSQLSPSWEDKSPARRFVTRSTTQLKSDAWLCQLNKKRLSWYMELQAVNMTSESQFIPILSTDNSLGQSEHNLLRNPELVWQKNRM